MGALVGVVVAVLFFGWGPAAQQRRQGEMTRQSTTKQRQQHQNQRTRFFGMDWRHNKNDKVR